MRAREGHFKVGYVINCVCGRMSHLDMVEKEIEGHLHCGQRWEVWVWGGAKEAHF